MFDFGWQTYALLGAGLLFVVLEVFFPSGGLLGIGSGICLILGGYFCFREQGVKTLLAYGVTVAVLAPVTILSAFSILPKTPFGRAIILAGPDLADRRATERGLEGLVGQRGKTLTPLRPSGIAILADRRVDVVTRGAHLDSGEPIQVVKVEGNRVIVEREPSRGGPEGVLG
jgi:membrane-bound serine protease (ClpP class)